MVFREASPGRKTSPVVVEMFPEEFGKPKLKPALSHRPWSATTGRAGPASSGAFPAFFGFPGCESSSWCQGEVRGFSGKRRLPEFVRLGKGDARLGTGAWSFSGAPKPIHTPGNHLQALQSRLECSWSSREPRVGPGFFAAPFPPLFLSNDRSQRGKGPEKRPGSLPFAGSFSAREWPLRSWERSGLGWIQPEVPGMAPLGPGPPQVCGWRGGRGSGGLCQPILGFSRASPSRPSSPKRLEGIGPGLETGRCFPQTRWPG